MVSGIPPVGITQNERFLSCDTVLLGVRYASYVYVCMWFRLFPMTTYGEMEV
jgi:hypothetical protein